MTLKITGVEVKDRILTFEMRVIRGLYYPTPTKGYTNILTLYVTQFFMEFLKLAEVRGIFIIKNDTLCVKFLYEKNAISVMFIYAKR